MAPPRTRLLLVDPDPARHDPQGLYARSVRHILDELTGASPVEVAMDSGPDA